MGFTDPFPDEESAHFAYTATVARLLMEDKESDMQEHVPTNA